MDIVTIVATIVSALAAAASAAATIYIAQLTKKTIDAYNTQIQIGQEQVRVTQMQTFNQARPILVPPDDISNLLRNEAGIISLKLGVGQIKIDGLQNIGVGPAFSIYGIIFGSPLQNRPPHERHIIWNYGILTPGETGKEITLSQGVNLKSDTKISNHVLYVPDDKEHIGRIARLTLTYHDIFGRKFASIYDYQINLGWICVEHIDGIKYDLYELDSQDPVTQQTNQFYHNMSKMH